MRWHTYLLLCVVVLIIAVSPSPALGKGGKGGGKGGGGRPSFSGGRGGGGGGGGQKFTQQSKGGGGHVADKGGKAADKPTKDKLAHESHDSKDHDSKDRDSKDKPSKDKPFSAKDGGTPTNTGEAYNKKQKQLEIEQRNRDKRLAQADHLRQIAERNGNENLMANADRMEAFAHDHYARRVSQLEKFGVTDPTLDPGGLLDPLVDPVGEFAEIPLLPLLP